MIHFFPDRLQMWPTQFGKQSIGYYDGVIDGQQGQGGMPNVPTIIGEGLVIDGTLTTAGEIQIDGGVEGEINCISLVIGSTGYVHGNVRAQKLTVMGRIRGDIHADAIQLSAGSSVEGNIVHRSLTVQQGAFVDADCRRVRDAANGSAEPPR
jgi:cytoskeletal protein CcmA (bactofilin family)